MLWDTGHLGSGSGAGQEDWVADPRAYAPDGAIRATQALYGASGVKRFRPRLSTWPRRSFGPGGTSFSFQPLRASEAALAARSSCWLARGDPPSPLPPRATLSDTVRRLEDKWVGESRASTIRGGACHRARIIAPHPCIRQVQRGPDHDAVMRIGGEAPGRRAHSRKRCQTMACFGGPPPRIVSGDRRCPVRQAPRACPALASCCAQDDASWHFAGGHHAPQCDQQLSCQRHDQGLARAAAGIRRARPIPLCQRTLLLEQEKAPGQLDHPAPHARVARLGEPLLAPPAAALVGRAGQARIAGDGSSIAPGPGKHLLDQHVRCLKADTDDPGEQANHDMRFVWRSLVQPLRTGLLDLLDLVHDEPQAGHVATQFEQRVGRERYPLGRPQRCKTVRRVAQRGLEGPNPEADQTALHPVDQARALTDEPLALTVGALGILLRQRRDRNHVAVIGFAAQPAEEDAFEQSRVEAICLGPAMLAGDGHAGGVNDIGFDAPGPEPARQPEAIAARLEGDGDAGDRAAVLGRLCTPAHQQTEQFHLAWFELLERMALDPWDNAGDEPARLAHLDDSDDGAILLQGRERPTQIVELLWHGTLHRRCFQRRWCHLATVRP